MDTRMGALTFLLVCVCPLCCTASWMRLGVSPSLADPPSCSSLPLSPPQRALCLRRPFLLPSISDGARLAVAECHSQFRHERWNCSTSDSNSVFGYELTSGSKETAFIYAVLAAGLVHAVTRSCSRGNMTECGCDARLTGTDGMFEWGGCSDSVRYGSWFSRKFIDHNVKNSTESRGGFTMEGMNQHNAEVGRQAVERTMSTDCRCHGVSGSCAVKTCWRTMAPFNRVGLFLKERYEHSVQVIDRSQKRKPRNKKPHQRPRVDKTQLVYFNKSPNYCLPDVRRGVRGTKGRTCNRQSTGPDSCNLLCCGRGYNTHVVRHVQRCECKFVWCCYVRCRRCESMNDMHTCK